VHFALNQASLTAQQADILDRAAAVLKEDPLLQVNVEGYTCSLGTPAHNLLLGKHRATTVSDYLVSKGVSADRLHTVSFGEDHAKYDNSTESSRQLNRRVAIVPTVQP
jgi:OOP family OmpA-OmpF porin